MTTTAPAMKASKEDGVEGSGNDFRREHVSAHPDRPVQTHLPTLTGRFADPRDPCLPSPCTQVWLPIPGAFGRLYKMTDRRRGVRGIVYTVYTRSRNVPVSSPAFLPTQCRLKNWTAFSCFLAAASDEN